MINAVTGGRQIELASILKHELSPVPLSLNVGPKAESANILMNDIAVPSQIPDTDQETCDMIDGHALIHLETPVDVTRLVILQRCSFNVSLVTLVRTLLGLMWYLTATLKKSLSKA